MKNFIPKRLCGMGVIVGLTRSEAEKAAVAETFDPNEPVYLSNENCPLQHTISGSITGLRKNIRPQRKHSKRDSEVIEGPSSFPLCIG